jgi:hypothetical protein
MPIRDIQERFRELGRIRLGVKEANRPKKIAKFRLTSKWRHLIEDVATAYGGTPQAWEHPQDGAQWEVFIEADHLEVFIPPGTEVLTQWLELWKGGGCERRCDGVRQVLQDRACQCPKDTAERVEMAAQGKACKETTRLSVMLPQTSDLGIWRLESHGHYAAVELAGALGLVELATQRGVIVPATLALEHRTVKRPGQPIRRFAVPVVGFPHRLGDVLGALGMAERGGLPLLPGAATRPLEARPALDAGGVPALPAPTEFGDTVPGETIEVATLPAEAIPEPEVLEPPAIEDQGGGAEATLGFAQALAMRARDAGMDEDQRHGLISAITEGRTASGKGDLNGLERNRLMAAVISLVRGGMALAVSAEGTWHLLESGVGAVANSGPIPADAASLTIVFPAAHVGEWRIPGREGPTLDPPAPVAELSPEPAEDVRAAPSASPVASGPALDVAGWRAFLREKGLRLGDALKAAAEKCPKGKEPGNLEQLVAMPDVATYVRDTLAGKE